MWQFSSLTPYGLIRSDELVEVVVGEVLLRGAADVSAFGHGRGLVEPKEVGFSF